jgi:hypothetical protein
MKRVLLAISLALDVSYGFVAHPMQRVSLRSRSYASCARSLKMSGEERKLTNDECDILNVGVPFPFGNKSSVMFCFCYYTCMRLGQDTISDNSCNQIPRGSTLVGEMSELMRAQLEKKVSKKKFTFNIHAHVPVTDICGTEFFRENTKTAMPCGISATKRSGPVTSSEKRRFVPENVSFSLENDQTNKLTF